MSHLNHDHMNGLDIAIESGHRLKIGCGHMTMNGNVLLFSLHAIRQNSSQF